MFVWVLSIEDDEDLEADLRAQVSVYLVPPDPKEQAESAPLSRWYSAVFERELGAWYQDEVLWPRDRGLGAFRRWFEVVTDSIVVDLTPGPIEHQDW